MPGLGLMAIMATLNSQPLTFPHSGATEIPTPKLDSAFDQCNIYIFGKST